MIEREKIDKAYVDTLLAVAENKITLGKTEMGIVWDDQLGLVAIGKRNISKTKADVFHIFGLLGPVSVANTGWRKDNEYSLAKVIDQVNDIGLLDEMFALVVDVYVFFGLYAEGVIVDNKLTVVGEGLVECRVKVGDGEFRVLAVESHGIPELAGHSIVAVDAEMNPLPD